MTQKVRETQAAQPTALEFGKDTVYKRSNIVAVDDDDFKGWEYNEEQFTYPEYVKVLQQEKAQDIEIKIALAELAEAVLGG